MLRRSTILLMIGLLMLTSTAAAQHPPTPDAQHVRLIERTGGPVTAALPRPDGSVLVASGPRVLHIDMESQRTLTSLDVGHGPIIDMLEAAGTIYALTGEGIVVMDGLQVIGFAPGGGQAMDIRADLLVVAAQEAGVRIMRLIPGQVPRLIATLPLDAAAVDIALSQQLTRAYVATGESGLVILDTSDPTAPTPVEGMPNLAPAETVTVAGQILVVGSGGRIYTVDAPRRTVIGVHAPLREGRRIVTQEEYAFIADAADGLKIMWQITPERMVQIYGETGRPALDVAVAGDLAAVVGPEGLRLFDVSSRYRPLTLSMLELPGDPAAVTLNGDQAHVALGGGGVAVVDITSRVNPRLSLRTPIEGTAGDVLVYDGRAYIAAGEAGLVVQGESGIEATLPLGCPADELARRGDFIYVACGEAGLIAVDVLRPAAPFIAGTLPPAEGESFNTVTIEGKRAYVATSAGYQVIDISFPDQMGRLISVAGDVVDLSISGVINLTTLSPAGMATYDVRFTSDPVPLGTYHAIAGAADLLAVGNRVYVTNSGPGADLAVINLLTPDFPSELGSIGQRGYTEHVTVVEEDVLLARGQRGLRRYSVSEGGFFTQQQAYDTLGGAAVLTTDAGRIAAGGRTGWLTLTPRQYSPTPEAVQAVTAAGNDVAVAMGGAGIALYRSGELVAQRETVGAAVGIVMDEAFIYAADSGGLAIFDRQYLVPVQRVDTAAPARDLLWQGERLLLPLADGTLAVIEVGQPDSGLEQVGRIEANRPQSLLTDGRTVYYLVENGITRLDLNSYQRAGEASLQIPATRGFFRGDLLAAYTAETDLRLYDVTDLTDGVDQRVLYDVSGRQMAFAADKLFTANGLEGLFRIVSGTPVNLLGERVYGLLAVGDVLFAAGDSLTAWQVAGDGETQIAALPLPARGAHIARLGGDHLLVSTEGGLVVVGWDGTNLERVAYLSTGTPVQQAAAVDGWGFADLSTGGLLTVDLRDPAQPTTQFTHVSGEFVSDLLALPDGRLLVAWEDHIEALRVGDLTQGPRLTGVEPGIEGMQHIAVDGTGRMAAARGESGIALMDGDTVTYAETPGRALRTALHGDHIFVADGRCGLRVFAIGNGLRETGYWAGEYVSDVVAQPDGTLIVADAGEIVTLQHDPTLPIVPPATPQNPSPANGAGELGFDVTLAWGPAPDPCDEVAYTVYFGSGDEPPIAGRTQGQPRLELGGLEPARTYAWRIEATDRQGDTVSSPVWRFSTAAGAPSGGGVIPAPPTFLSQLLRHPAAPAVLLVSFIGGGVYFYWRRNK